MKSLIVRLPLAIAAALTLANCKSEAPAMTGRIPPEKVSFAPEKPVPANFADEWLFTERNNSAEQAKYDENSVSMLFHVSQNGESVNKLTEKDFRVRENSVEVKNFDVAGDVEELKQVADIAFVVDITTSMTDFIDDAKRKLQAFVRNADNQGYHIRMCLVKFGDYIVMDQGQQRPCDRFYDSANKAEVDQFITALGDLHAAGRGFDPGAPDIAENPFRALVDTAKLAPWGNDSLRFAILVTDAPFQYDPTGINDQDLQVLLNGLKGNRDPKKLNPHAASGNPAYAAPRMSEIAQAIDGANLRVFPVTPKIPGFFGEFDGQAGITRNADDFFEFKSWKKDALGKILKNIMNSMNTTYKVTYNVEKNGLDPQLKLEQRKIEVTTKSGDVTLLKSSATNPQGRPSYKTTFEVDPQPVQPDSVQVFVNEVALARGDYSVSGGNVIFKQGPPPGAKIRFVYLYQDIAKNFDRKPITVKGNGSNVRIILNGKPANANDYTVTSNGNGTANVQLKPTVVGDADPYEIRRNRGLKIRVISNL